MQQQKTGCSIPSRFDRIFAVEAAENVACFSYTLGSKESRRRDSHFIEERLEARLAVMSEAAAAVTGAVFAKVVTRRQHGGQDQ
jgi:hypothetical protein